MPIDAAHAYLTGDRSGVISITTTAGADVALKWHAWFVRKGVPHVVEWNDSEAIVQLYRHFYYSSTKSWCCPSMNPPAKRVGDRSGKRSHGRITQG
ncbi:MAG: hypothetical protein ACREM3_26185 [Candidatus Rokuibacteriota bacterium]